MTCVRVLALSLAACGVSPGQVSLRGRLDDAHRPPVGEATGGAGAASTIPDHVPDAAALSWETGQEIGQGVAFKDTKTPAGENVFIGYAGYRVSLASAEAWVQALHESSLAARGVRYLWAVQGPNDRTYANLEIGNARIVMTMLPRVGPRTRFVLVAGHSSGSFVAHELLGRLAGGMDPQGVTVGRVVYFDLDGGASGLTTRSVGRLRRAYFVGARDATTGTDSPRQATMRSLGATFAFAGGYWQYDASDARCHEGAQWCVHDALITTRPHAPTSASAELDYSDFAGRDACHAWIDAKSEEAGLQP
ncbi:MAG TPA: hypothetical protein VE987_19720 [Polyangiaceae bacterium]|nr:hypothetical protein [Polyangiaceae bacterium]